MGITEASGKGTLPWTSEDDEGTMGLWDFHAYLKKTHGDPEVAFVQLMETMGHNRTMQDIHKRMIEDLEEIEKGLFDRGDSLRKKLESTNPPVAHILGDA